MFLYKGFIPYNPVDCITQTEEPGVLSEQYMDDSNSAVFSLITVYCSLITDQISPLDNSSFPTAKIKFCIKSLLILLLCAIQLRIKTG
jgi:hypothetical protein